MKAKLSVVVPFVLVVPDSTPFDTFEYEDEGCLVRILPPGKSDAPVWSDVPEDITVNGISAFACNAMHFEFTRNEFNRDSGAEPDPSVAALERAITGLVARLRFVSRAFQAYTRFPNATWRIEYSNDDGSLLPPEQGKIRARAGRAWTWSYVAVTPEVWRMAHELPVDWQPGPWDDILLDAYAAMPKVGSAMVLGATALEVFISEIVEKLAAHTSFSPTIWGWINDRGDWQKEPSTDEQFDQLLAHFAGQSLKTRPELWESYKKLRMARNKFVHKGQPLVGGKPLSEQEAMKLLAGAGEIIEWTRSILPEELQWPAPKASVDLGFSVKIIDP